MKITDMNLICLEECLEHLKLGDLLSVADANKRLRRAAEFVYNRKYGGKCVYFYDVKRQNGRYIKEFIKQLIFRDLKTSFQLLRCFGHVIKEFLLCTGVEELELLLLNALNEFCAETLIKVTLFSHHGSNVNLSVFTKPFTKLQEVVMRSCRFTEKGEFNRIFPKIKRFEYVTNVIDNYECLVDHYPHLEGFEIVFSSMRCVPVSIRENITAVLRLNPQLKKLRLSVFSDHDRLLNGETHFDEDTFRSVMEPMQNLEELYLNGIALFPNFTGPKIYLKNVKKFTIGDLKINYPFVFDQLEYFHFTLYTDELPADVYDFIDKHQTINTLSIWITRSLSNINVTRLVEALSMLTKISIRYFSNVISVDDVLSLVSSFKLLKTFCLFDSRPVNTLLHNELRARLGNEWKICLEENKYGYKLIGTLRQSKSYGNEEITRVRE